MKNNKQESKALSLIRAYVILMIFLLLLLSILMGSIIIIVLFKTHVFNDFSEINLIRSIIIVSLISLLLGTLLTAIYGTGLIRKFEILIRGMQNLAEGKFETRIDVRSKFASEFFDGINDNFNMMAERLGDQEMLHNNFINDFSHEFKTPIVSIKGFAKILKNSDLSEEERQEYLDIIIKESDRLSDLSRNVLALSKVENSSELENVEEFDLSEQVRTSIIILQNKWQNKKQELQIDLDEIRYKGNEEYLSLVWTNLIDNAVKYTPEEGKIDILLKENKKEVVFQVKDSGCGIAQKKMQRIFDKFYQGDESHQTEGNGIGLSLVDKILKLHKASIEIESEEKKGTAVTVRLPKA